MSFLDGIAERLPFDSQQLVVALLWGPLLKGVGPVFWGCMATCPH